MKTEDYDLSTMEGRIDLCNDRLQEAYIAVEKSGVHPSDFFFAMTGMLVTSSQMNEVTKAELFSLVDEIWERSRLGVDAGTAQQLPVKATGFSS